MFVESASHAAIANDLAAAFAVVVGDDLMLRVGVRFAADAVALAVSIHAHASCGSALVAWI